MNRFASRHPDDYEDRLDAMFDAGDRLRKERKEKVRSEELKSDSDPIQLILALIEEESQFNTNTGRTDEQLARARDFFLTALRDAGVNVRDEGDAKP